MAISRIGGAAIAVGSAGTTLTLTTGMPTTVVGDLYAVKFLCSGAAGSTFTISDTQSNAWSTAVPVWTGNGTDRAQVFYAFANSTTATSITMTTSASTIWRDILVDVFRGTALDSSVVGAHVETSGSGTPTTAGMTLTSNDCVVNAYCNDSVTAVGNIDGSAATKGADDANGDWSEYRFLTGRSGISVTSAFAGSGVYTIGAIEWKAPSGTATLDQFGYRARNDDGTEITATWKAAQNTGFTVVPGTRFRLRVGVNAVNDATSKNFKLQYRIVGAAGWRTIDTIG